MALLERTGLYGVPLYICWDNSLKKRDDPVKNGTSGHPSVYQIASS
jgi:hypothetical protein